MPLCGKGMPRMPMKIHMGKLHKTNLPMAKLAILFPKI
jgi:hypothetical protein